MAIELNILNFAFAPISDDDEGKTDLTMDLEGEEDLDEDAEDEDLDGASDDEDEKPESEEM